MSSNNLSIIIDTDAGLDDAWGMFLLFAAQRRINLNILGITCVSGNTGVDNVCINVLRTLEAAGKDIPVYRGASSALVEYEDEKPNCFFGEDGFGGAVHESSPDLSQIKPENAVVALNRIVCENKGQVTLVCIGPLTNIALCIRTYSDFEKHVKGIYIMGGNYTGVGNTTSCAEFNFHADPEAAHIVFSSAIEHKVLLPWEVCKANAFTLDWRDNCLGNCTNAPIQLMNRAEKPLRSKPGFTSWVSCDQHLLAILVEPSMILESQSSHITVELHGKHTRGQVVVDHKNKNPHNVVIITAADQKVLERLLLDIHSL